MSQPQADGDRRRDVPAATYRLQVHAGFGLDDAAGVAGYLADLGVTHAYSSPLLRSAEGSTTATTWSTTRTSTRRAAARRASTGSSPALHEHGLGPGRRHRAQPHGRRRPGGRAVVVGRAPARAGQRRTRRRSTSTGSSAAARSASRCWASAGRRRRSCEVGATGELRYYDNRFPIAPGHRRAARRRRCTTGSTTSWSTGGAADAELNYRRFFAVTTLAGVRVEDPEVFDATHALRSLQLVRRGRGRRAARSTTPTACADPEGYLDRLAEAAGRPLDRRREDPRARRGAAGAWATAGTTGYDALAEVDRVLIDPAGEAPLTALDTELAGAPVDSRDAGARQQARGRRRDARLEVARLRAGDRRAARRRPAAEQTRGAGRAAGRASRSTAPTCPTAASTSTRRWPPPASAGRTWSPAARRAAPGARPGRHRGRRPGSSRPAAW